MPKLPQFAGVLGDHRVGGDVARFRRRDVAANLFDQMRNVVEQLFGGEDGIGVYRQQRDQAFEPAQRQRACVVAN